MNLLITTAEVIDKLVETIAHFEPAIIADSIKIIQRYSEMYVEFKMKG